GLVREVSVRPPAPWTCRMRSPAIPCGVTVAEGRDSPAIDFTGYRQISWMYMRWLRCGRGARDSPGGRLVPGSAGKGRSRCQTGDAFLHTLIEWGYGAHAIHVS